MTCYRAPGSTCGPASPPTPPTAGSLQHSAVGMKNTAEKGRLQAAVRTRDGLAIGEQRPVQIDLPSRRCDVHREDQRRGDDRMHACNTAPSLSKHSERRTSSATGSVAAPKLVRTSVSVLFVASAPKIALCGSVLLCERTRHEQNRSRQEGACHSLARVCPAAAACVGQQLSRVEHLALPANHLRVAARPPHLERCTCGRNNPQS